MTPTTPQTFTLVEGTFTPDLARQVIGAMLQSKLDFHNLQIHSEWERTGHPSPSSEKRLETLTRLDHDLKALFQEAATHNKTLQITGTLQITLLG